jgi:hypothetical protein
MTEITNQIIADTLNVEESLSSDLSDGDRITVLGIELLYSENSEEHSKDVTACLDNKSFCIEKKGYKETSYGQWVDTQWPYDWEALRTEE